MAFTLLWNEQCVQCCTCSNLNEYVAVKEHGLLQQNLITGCKTLSPLSFRWRNMVGEVIMLITLAVLSLCLLNYCFLCFLNITLWTESNASVSELPAFNVTLTPKKTFLSIDDSELEVEISARFVYYIYTNQHTHRFVTFSKPFSHNRSPTDKIQSCQCYWNAIQGPANPVRYLV